MCEHFYLLNDRTARTSAEKEEGGEGLREGWVVGMGDRKPGEAGREKPARQDRVELEAAGGECFHQLSPRQGIGRCQKKSVHV